MNTFQWNLVLALVWAFATGRLTASNLLIGLVLGYWVLFFTRRGDEGRTYFVRVGRVVKFLFFYLGQLIMSNLRVAYDVVTPRNHMRPGVIAVPLDVETDAEIVLLANLITLTPGTLSLDLSPDRKTLYVHVMYIDEDDEQARRQIKDGLETRVLELLR
jgi:multicomponent Na+:H+ antiporter subunit E